MRHDTGVRIIQHMNVRGHYNAPSYCHHWYITFDGAKCTNPETIEQLDYSETNGDLHRASDSKSLIIGVEYSWYADITKFCLPFKLFLISSFSKRSFGKTLHPYSVYLPTYSDKRDLPPSPTQGVQLPDLASTSSPICGKQPVYNDTQTVSKAQQKSLKLSHLSTSFCGHQATGRNTTQAAKYGSEGPLICAI